MNYFYLFVYFMYVDALPKYTSAAPQEFLVSMEAKEEYQMEVFGIKLRVSGRAPHAVSH